MIESVTFEKTTYAQLPNKFEAGTPNIAGAVGLARPSITSNQSVSTKIAAYENELLTTPPSRFATIPGVRIVGNAETQRAASSRFIIEHPPIAAHDLGIALDLQGIAVRTGHHCCQPVMDRFGIPATVRASFAMYNTPAEVDALVAALKKIVAAEDESARRLASAAASVERGGDHISTRVGAIGHQSSRCDRRRFRALRAIARQKTNTSWIWPKSCPRTFDLLKKTGIPRVTGCMSEVYLVARKVHGQRRPRSNSSPTPTRKSSAA